VRLSSRGAVLPLLLALLSWSCHEEVPQPGLKPETIAACSSLLADHSFPGSPEAAEAARTAGASWAAKTIRHLYVCRALAIGERDAVSKSEGLLPEERARRACSDRRNARLTARAMMDPESAAALRVRDLQKYDDEDGPTSEWLVARSIALGAKGDDLFLGIIESAQRTNAETNAELGL
jgi:hypothetical protein